MRVRLRRFIDDENVVVDVQRANGVETLASSGVAFARLRARALDRARVLARRTGSERRRGVVGGHAPSRAPNEARASECRG